MRTAAIFAIALTTAACGSQPAEQQIVNRAETADSYQQRILALPEPQRRAVFLRAVRDAGQDCQEVRSAEGAGTYRGQPVWRATCRGGGEWTIVITDGGIAQVLNAHEGQLVTDRPPANAADAGERK